MNQFSRVHKEISDLTRILSVIIKRGFQDVEEEVQHPPSARLDMDESEHVDEDLFEQPPANGPAEKNAITRRTLDRLAEVLAKVKTAKTRQGRRRQNKDAKHVSSVIMLERKDKSVEFFCAKNEGLDEEDVAFLKDMERLFGLISKDKGSQRRDLADQVFDLVYRHSESRVTYHSEILRNVFTEACQTTEPRKLTLQNVQNSYSKNMSMKWEDEKGLRYEFAPQGAREECKSDQAAACLSNKEEETLIQECHGEIRQLFGGTVFSTPQSRTRETFRKAYLILRHPRQRPALKAVLRLELGSNERLFSKAWGSLLYLARIYYAAVTFVEFATETQYRGIQFRKLQAPEPYRSEPDTRTPMELLTSLGCSSNTLGGAWRDFLLAKETVKETRRLSNLTKTVHGEIQLFAHVEQHQAVRVGEPGGKFFPYIGCSKRCCFFCEVFRCQHGVFKARGTHGTLFPLWGVPQTFPPASLQLLRGFSEHLRGVLLRRISLPKPPMRQDLLTQSSAALSTAQAVREEAPTYPVLPQVLSNLRLGFGGVIGTDTHVEFVPSMEDPGFATVMGGPGHGYNMHVAIEEAETIKINHERSIAGLEKLNEMRPVQPLDKKPCRRCKSPAEFRCSACWTLYCSATCQRRHWPSHVFTCRTLNRPNDVDYLRLAIGAFPKRLQPTEKDGDEEAVQKALVYLLSDDHLCTTFGITTCKSLLEVVLLVCLYCTMLLKLPGAVKAIQYNLQTGHLWELMKRFCNVERQEARITRNSECTCVTWFLERYSSEPLPFATGSEAGYAFWNIAFSCVIEHFDLTSRLEAGEGRLNCFEADVLELYLTIQPTVGLIPDIHSSLWIKFRFCFARSFKSRTELAHKYLALAHTKANFSDIVLAYKSSSLEDLMRAHGVDMSELNSQGIRLSGPSTCEDSIYRLMIGAEHALSGRFCGCFMVHKPRRCHARFETHLDREASTHFGFTFANPWERWQLLNFYGYLFHLPNFSPLRMSEAVEAADRESIEKYLDTLVPKATRRLYDRHRARPLFPRLKDRLRATTVSGQPITHFHNPCCCKLHDVMGPPGLTFLTVDRILRDTRHFFSAEAELCPSPKLEIQDP